MASKFCSVDDVKPFINAAPGYTDDDAAILAHVKTATSLIRQYTRRNWEEKERTQIFDTRDVNTYVAPSRGLARFVLAERPVTDVSKVVYNAGGDFTNTIELDTDLYTVDLDNARVIMYPSVMRTAAGSLQITYTAGYPLDPTDNELVLVSENLRAACAVQAAFTFKRTINETQGNRQSSNKTGYTLYDLTPAGLIGEALALIKSEVRLLVGGNG